MAVSETPTDHWHCPWCMRSTHHPDDVRNRYCPCCGSADGLLPKDCEHRRSGRMVATVEEISSGS